MNVLHINTYLTGGAAIAAKRIHKGLLDAGVNSKFLYKYGWSEDPSYIEFKDKRTLSLIKKIKKKLDIFSFKKWQKLKQEKLYYLDKRPEGFDIFSPINLYTKLRFEDLPFRPDVIHLHWVEEFFDYEEFFQSIPDDVPIVWTCHDMSPFTGGCHYSWDCKNYMQYCGNCPQLANSNAKDLSNKIITDKINIFRACYLTRAIDDSNVTKFIYNSNITRI